MKSAETDATKRAFVTFGNVFKLALYDKAQRNVGRPEPGQIAAQPVAALEGKYVSDLTRQDRALSAWETMLKMKWASL